jgi:MipA family protein
MLYFLFFLTSMLVEANLEKVPSQKPLLEYGVFAGAGWIPFYPASDQGKIRYLAAPMVRYRGLRLRSDEEDSMKARIFKNSFYGIDLSFGGAFTANSSDIEIRKGMPDLDWIGEIGPRWYFFAYKSDFLWWRFNLPVRGAFSTNIKEWTYQGLVFAPSMNIRFFFDSSKYNSFFINLVQHYTTLHLQKYYFEVPPAYANSFRPAYKAKPGLMDTALSLGYIHEMGQWGYYAGWELNSFKGAANRESPLHKADFNQAWFLGISYFFYQSEERGYQ